MSIIVRERPSPYEVMIMAVAVVGGLTLLVLRRHLGSTLSSSLPVPVTVTLGAGMFVGGVLSIAGLVIRTIQGSLIELAGQVGLAPLFLTYSGFSLYFTGLRGLITEMFFLFMALSAAWRAVQLRSVSTDAENEIHARSGGRGHVGG